MGKGDAIESLSVIVPTNPFARGKDAKHCLCALDVEKLMDWWPGTPHSPHRNADKVKAIQRALDWKRVAHIAAYLLQTEITDAPDKIVQYFSDIYEPKRLEPGREWPPKVSKVISYQRSVYPSFSNVLVHVNGAKLISDDKKPGTAVLSFDPDDKTLAFSIIDGQHRINGAYLAVKILKETNPNTRWEIPAEVFIDLDQPGKASHQAQIFIDVNFYQKKVDRSLVADLFPTARGARKSLDNKERAQDIGRKLMLERGPLVGMVQIPGIKYGVKDVIALSTLVGAVEDVLDVLNAHDLTSLDEQVDFIAQSLSSWLHASGRREDQALEGKLSSGNVVYQGRILVSVIGLIPAMLWRLRKSKHPLISDKSEQDLVKWLNRVMETAGLLKKGKFIDKNAFKDEGYLGSGGIGRFRDRLWAAVFDTNHKIAAMKQDNIAMLAEENRKLVIRESGIQENKE